MTEISFGVLFVFMLTRPVAFLAFLYLGSLWMSEWGTRLDLRNAGSGASHLLGFRSDAPAGSGV